MRVLIFLLLTGMVLADTKRIEFMAGATGSRLEGAVARGEQNTYMIACGGSQTMTVTVKSVEANAVFQVYSPDGKKLADGTSWSGKLPRKGDYRIVVGATRGGAEYVLNVSVK